MDTYACQDNSDGSAGSYRYYCEQAAGGNVDYYLEAYNTVGCQGKYFVKKYTMGSCYFYLNLYCPTADQKPWTGYTGLLSLTYSPQSACVGDPASFLIMPDGCHPDQNKVSSSKSFCDVTSGGIKEIYSSSTTCSSGTVTKSVTPLVKCKAQTLESTCCTADDSKC
jgi:hypothetical protein